MNGSNRTRNFKTAYFKAGPNRQKCRLRQTGETSKHGGSKLEGQEINLARAGKQQQRYWTAGERTAAGGASKM